MVRHTILYLLSFEDTKAKPQKEQAMASVATVKFEACQQPHSIFISYDYLSCVCIINRTHEDDSEQNIFNGIKCVAAFFLIISLLAFPNGKMAIHTGGGGHCPFLFVLFLAIFSVYLENP